MQQYLKRDSTNDEDTLAQLLQNENFSNLTKLPEEKASSSPRNPASSTTQDNTSITCDEYSEIPTIFEGLKFVVVNFSDVETTELKSNIEQMAGQVVSKSYKGVSDFAVVPIFNSELRQTASEVVTEMWIAECFQEGELKEIMYYHRPLTVIESQPLQNCVVTLSTYTNYERNFLKVLVIKLGGVFQEQFARVKSVAKNVLESTHLISPEATGKKYMAAIKWKLPVVNKDWLLECAKTGKRVLENDFLVGDSIGKMVSKCYYIQFNMNILAPERHDEETNTTFEVATKFSQQKTISSFCNTPPLSNHSNSNHNDSIRPTELSRRESKVSENSQLNRSTGNLTFTVYF